MAIDSLTSERARRALSHGSGIDGILFAILAGIGIVVAILLLIAGLQTAETRAVRDVGTSRSGANVSNNAEIGVE